MESLLKEMAMRSKSFSFSWFSLVGFLTFLLAFSTTIYSQVFPNVDVVFKGAGWIKSGMIMHSTDTLTGGGKNNYNKNWQQDAGALLTGIVNLNENFEAAFGLGAVQKHPVQGGLETAKNLRLGLNIFNTQSRLTFFPQGKKDYKLKITLGLFPYKYDNDIKNLGFYLIRGAVYPGLLVSGFESKEILNNANMLGGHLQYILGTYTSDFILTSETDLKPYYDFSAIYVGTFKPSPMFELGGGVNFYHYLPVRPNATTPSEEEGYAKDSKKSGGVAHPFDYTYTLPVISGTDTSFVYPSHKGIKLMGRAAVDLKEVFGLSAGFNKPDLRIYSEAALIGIKNYNGMYGTTAQRMPLMVGVNLPTWKILDILAVEVEYYGSKLVPDYKKVMDNGSAVPQTPWITREATPEAPVPTGDPVADSAALFEYSKIDLNDYKYKPYDVDADNIKWSIYFAKIFAGHVKIAGQIANDHLRTGGTAEGLAALSYEEALTTMDDWYWTLKLSYFF